MLPRRFLYTLGGCRSFSTEVRAEQPPGPTIVEYAGRAREAAGQRRSSGLVVFQPPLRKKAADAVKCLWCARALSLLVKR